MKKNITLIISLLIGIIIFGFFLYDVGVDSVVSILSNAQPFYLGLYLLFTTLTFVPTVWRWGIVLKAHGKDIPFFALMRYTMAGFAVSYVTPSSRIGGEPLRAYMLKKEQKVDLKTGSSSIIIEKFIELSGSIVFGLLGMVLFFTLPGLSFWLKFIFGACVLFGFAIMLIFYYRSITGKGSFSSLFLLLRLNKIAKWKNFVHVIKDVEGRMQKFFVESKRAFLLASLTYLLYGILTILEFNFLLLGFGIDESLRTVILAIAITGFVGFIPIPASLGFLEAGQSSLFALTSGEGSIGFVLSIMVRIRSLIFVALGFSFVTYFSGKQLGRKNPKTSFVALKKKKSKKFVKTNSKRRRTSRTN